MSTCEARSDPEAQARVFYDIWRWYVHIASAFPMAHHYRAVLAWGS